MSELLNSENNFIDEKYNSNILPCVLINFVGTFISIKRKEIKLLGDVVL